MLVTVSRNGGATIPEDLRRKYKLQRGARVSIIDYAGVLTLIPALDDPVRQAAGMLEGRTSLTRALIDERQAGRSRRQ